MKYLLKWTFVVLCLCAGFASCSDDEEEVIPELLVSNPTLAVSGSGGTFEVPITTTDLATDETVQVTTDVDWITNLQAANDLFSFEVSKAPFDVESRTATITLSLSKHAGVKATCTLTQGKNQEDFYIRMDELRGESAIYTITPASSLSQGSFISYCFSAEELARYATADEVKNAIGAKQEAAANEMAEKYGVYIYHTLAWRSRPGDDSYQELVRDLEPGKEYCIVAFGYQGSSFDPAEEMKVTTDLVKYPFVTPNETTELSPVTLDVEVNVRGALYDVSATPSRNDVYLYVYSDDKSSFERSFPTDDSFKAYALELYYSGADYAHLMAPLSEGNYLKTGYGIESQVEGISCALAVDAHLNLLSDPVKATFTVGDPEQSDNVLTITPNEVKARRISYVVKGSNNDPFRVTITDADYLAELVKDATTPEEKEAVLYAFIKSDGISKEQTEVSTWTSTWPLTDYVILAVGVAGVGEAEVPTTKIFTQEVSTPAAVISSATCAFDIVKRFNSIEFASAFGTFGWEGYCATAFTFSQSDDAVAVFYDWDTMADFEEGKNYFEEEGMADSFEDCLYMYLEMGYEHDRLSYISTKENKDYILFAAAKDKDGNFGPITYFNVERDKLPVSPISELSVFNPTIGTATKSVQVPLRPDVANRPRTEASPLRQIRKYMPVVSAN